VETFCKKLAEVPRKSLEERGLIEDSSREKINVAPAGEELLRSFLA